MAPDGQTGRHRLQSTMQLNGLTTFIFGRRIPAGSGSPGLKTPGLQRVSQSPQPLHEALSIVGYQAISSLGAVRRLRFFFGITEPLTLLSVLL
jgi:hypothetical protein